mmetsp:Transcript_10913/g.33328  ORF Transcript_10913/g.33328 Transcript_10913/m.33328 type:complete len:203 (-) Transcript_10913:240-848(-)
MECFFLPSSLFSLACLSFFLIFFSFTGLASIGSSEVTASSSILCTLPRASSKFFFWVRCFVEATTSSPSLFTRFRSLLASCAFTWSGIQSWSWIFSLMSALVFTLFTFCPPAPPLLMNFTSTSSFVTDRTWYTPRTTPSSSIPTRSPSCASCLVTWDPASMAEEPILLLLLDLRSCRRKRLWPPCGVVVKRSLQTLPGVVDD